MKLSVQTAAEEGMVVQQYGNILFCTVKCCDNTKEPADRLVTKICVEVSKSTTLHIYRVAVSYVYRVRLSCWFQHLV